MLRFEIKAIEDHSGIKKKSLDIQQSKTAEYFANQKTERLLAGFCLVFFNKGREKWNRISISLNFPERYCLTQETTTFSQGFAYMISCQRHG